MKSFKHLSVLALAGASFVLAACDGRRENVEEATFRVESVSLEKSEIQKKDTFGLPQAKKFYFKSCITDSLARSAISISRFQVSDGHTSKQAITDKDGCLEWTEIHSFSTLQKEEIVKMDRTFTSEETYKGSVTVSLSFNPWQETLVDLRKSNDPDLDAQSQEAGFEADLMKGGRHVDRFSSAALTDVKLDFYGHDVTSAEITPLLTLKPAQKFRLSMRPQFLRRNIRNEVIYLDLTGGEFRIRLVILGENASEIPTPSDVVAYSDADIEVRDKGLAQKDIIVRIHDISAVLSRNQFFLIAEPKGAATDMAQAAVYKGFVGPLNGNNAAVDLIPFDGDTTAFITNVESAMTKLNEKKSALALFEETSGLRAETGSSNLKNLLAKKKPARDEVVSLMRSFCAKIYGADETTVITTESWLLGERQKTVNLLKSCQQKPEAYLRFERNEIVQDVLGKPRHRSDLLVPLKTIKISKDLRYQKVQSTDQKRNYESRYGWGASANADIGASWGLEGPVGAGITGKLGIGAGFGLKGGIGTEWVTSESLAKTEGEAVGAEISQSETFAISSVGYDVKVSTRTCLILGAIVGPARGFYACEDAVKERVTTETYHQVNHSVSNSVFSDGESASSTMWRVTIRGQENLKNFENLMTKGSGVLNFSELKIDNPEAPLLPDFKVNQSFPGIISSK